MNEAVLREKLMEISEAIEVSSHLNQAPAEGMYVAGAPTSTDEVVDGLRMQIKYLLFDLEASRRENRYLRQMLEMRPPQARRDSGDDGDETW